MDIRKPVTFLIVKNLHYEIGFTNITQLKILQENQETHFLQNNQTASKYCVRIIEEERTTYHARIGCGYETSLF